MSGEIKAQPDAGGHESLLTLASLGLIAEHVHQPVFAKSVALELVLLNSAYCQLVGRARDELLGNTESIIFGDDYAVASETSDREVLATMKPVSTSLLFPNATGQRQTRAAIKLPLTDAGGRVTHVVCVVGQAGEASASDQQLQEELERYAQERTRALRDVQEELLRKERLMVLGQLAAGLAHQIRNPLGAISNGLALIRRQTDGLDKPILQEAIKIANDEIWEANRIIGDLLEYARIQPAAGSEISLAEVVNAAVASEPVADNIQVYNNVGSLTAHADHKQVRIALGNLIRNSREAMPDGGELRFEATNVGDFVELRVSDTGIGITKEHAKLLFEPLVSGKPLGIGLGLPTARALIVNQGGSLDCVENFEQGACFVLRLPRQEPSEETDAD